MPRISLPELVSFLILSLAAAYIAWRIGVFGGGVHGDYNLLEIFLVGVVSVGLAIYSRFVIEKFFY